MRACAQAASGVLLVASDGGGGDGRRAAGARMLLMTVSRAAHPALGFKWRLVAVSSPWRDAASCGRCLTPFGRRRKLKPVSLGCQTPAMPPLSASVSWGGYLDSAIRFHANGVPLGRGGFMRTVSDTLQTTSQAEARLTWGVRHLRYSDRAQRLRGSQDIA
ncbi:hypothetical protein D3C72_1598230 [compost metagenome]